MRKRKQVKGRDEANKYAVVDESKLEGQLR